VNIEVDERTAAVLRDRSAELGVTVSELVSDLAMLYCDSVVVDTDDIAELERRCKEIVSGATTVPHEQVVHWMRTWGDVAVSALHEQ